MSDITTEDTRPHVADAPPSLSYRGRAPAGESYLAVLRRLHDLFKPRTYVEIGVNDGTTLRLSKCHTIAIDPCFRTGQLPMGNQPVCHLYQMTSDDFFRSFDPSAIFGQPIDMAFLDGMHWFEFLVRDFINVEKHARRNSIVLMHDCLPIDAHVGRRSFDDASLMNRSAHPDFWAGDVWKALLIITRFRPDLRVVVFDAAPTGLVAVTGLDPSSTLLADRYFELVAEYKELTLLDGGAARLERIPVIETATYAAYDALSTLFWL